MTFPSSEWPAGRAFPGRGEGDVGRREAREIMGLEGNKPHRARVLQLAALWRRVRRIDRIDLGALLERIRRAAE